MAVTSILMSCGSEDKEPAPTPPIQNPNQTPNPVNVDTVHFVAKANIQDISEKADAANIALNNSTNEYVGSFIIEEGAIKITGDDYIVLQKLGSLQARLRDKFSAKVTVCPKEGDIPLTYFEWEKWTCINLAISSDGKSFLVPESEKSKFGNQPVKVDDRFNGLKSVPVMDYGTDGSNLKEFLPDTIVFSKEQLDAKGLLQFKGLANKKIILKTIKDSKMKFGQPFFTNMNNEILGLFETPSVPDFAGSGMKIVYTSIDDLVITDYTEAGKSTVKTAPLTFTNYIYDIHAGNQGFAKLGASNKIVHDKYNATTRANIVASNPLEIVFPQTAQYKNPAGIYDALIGFGQPKFFEKGKHTMVDIMTMDWYRYTLCTKSWVDSWGGTTFNDINLILGSMSYDVMIVLSGDFPYYVATAGDNWDARRKIVKDMLWSTFGVKVADGHPLNFAVMSDVVAVNNGQLIR